MLAMTQNDPISPIDAPPGIVANGDALFLDLDGTLATIRDRPADVALEATMRAALTAARKAVGGRIAVVSGRALSDVEGLVGLPHLALAGIHGLELRHADGTLRIAEPRSELLAARRELASLAAREPRLFVEDKGLGVAIHFRLAPDLAAVAEQAARGIADRHGLLLQPGKMVFEVRQGGADKGSALRAFMETPPFRGARPIFVGDDHTDEAGFAAANALGGHGILVGAARPTAARYRLSDIAEVEAWLVAAGSDT